MPRAPFLEGFLRLFKYGNMEIEEIVVTFIDKSPRLTLFAGVVSENTCLAASSIRLLLFNTMRFGHRSFSLRTRMVALSTFTHSHVGPQSARRFGLMLTSEDYKVSLHSRLTCSI